MSRSSGPGRPISLRCAKCRRTGRDGFSLEATGKTALLTSSQRGRGGSRVLLHRVQYRCLGCGHVGWTRHADAERLAQGATAGPQKPLPHVRGTRS